MTWMGIVIVEREKMEKERTVVIGVRVGRKVKVRHIVILPVRVVNQILVRTVKIMERATMEKGKENIPPMGRVSHVMAAAMVRARTKTSVTTTITKKSQTSKRVTITLRRVTMAGRMLTVMRRSLKTETLLKTHRRAKRRKRKARFA